MFAVRRIVRSELSIKNHLYTSSVIRCDKPKDPKPVEIKSNIKVKKPIRQNQFQFASKSESKKKLTAELNVKDYANFNFKRQQSKVPRVQLYSDKSSKEEKLQAKKNLEKFTKEVESEMYNNTPINEKLKTLTVAKPKRKITKDKLVESAEKVALEFGGDSKKTAGDILGYLKKMEMKTERRKFSKNDVESVPENRPKPTQGHFRTNAPGFRNFGQPHTQGGPHQRVEHSDRTKPYIGQDEDDRRQDRRRQQQSEPKIKDVLLYGRHSRCQPLGIFKRVMSKDKGPKLKIWDELEELELKVESTRPPENYFEELIQWTDEGKLWHFPIDNDQGNDVEANVDFTEHIFLDEYLEPWCPKRGPIRHFMELVLTGLGKNHYLTVEEKKEHIYWYRDYFEGKKNLLKTMGALDSAKVLEVPAESNSTPENST